MKRRLKLVHSKVEQVPDYITPFTAYRAWQWDAEGVKSLNNAAWTPGVAFEAGCPISKAAAFNPHRCPDEDCTCGMYAGINLEHLISINYASSGIHGEVSLWGKLLKHSLGWRAQYAYPKFFIIPPSMVPYSMQDVAQRLETLIAFNVDIYLQVKEEASPKGEKIPLWMKDYGWSQQGIAHLIDIRKSWYETRPAVRKIAVGDRLHIKNQGIGVVSKCAIGVNGNILLIVKLWNFYVKFNEKNVKWSQKNWRWETAESGLTGGSPLLDL
jgi:hypothetical protein